MTKPKYQFSLRDLFFLVWLIGCTLWIIQHEFEERSNKEDIEYINYKVNQAIIDVVPEHVLERFSDASRFERAED